jgi:hypothetical protein
VKISFYPTNAGSIDSLDCIFGVSGILELHERKAWRVSGNPHVPKGSIFGEGVLQLIFGGVVAQVTDVDLAGDIPITMTRHVDQSLV